MEMYLVRLFIKSVSYILVRVNFEVYFVKNV